MADYGWKLALGCAGILENVNERRVLEPHEGLEEDIPAVAFQVHVRRWNPLRGWKDNAFIGMLYDGSVLEPHEELEVPRLCQGDHPPTDVGTP